MKLPEGLPGVCRISFTVFTAEGRTEKSSAADDASFDDCFRDFLPKVLDRVSLGSFDPLCSLVVAPGSPFDVLGVGAGQFPSFLLPPSGLVGEGDLDNAGAFHGMVWLSEGAWDLASTCGFFVSGLNA